MANQEFVLHIADVEWRSLQIPTVLVGSNDDSENFKRNISCAAALLLHIP